MTWWVLHSVVDDHDEEVVGFGLVVVTVMVNDVVGCASHGGERLGKCV